MSEKNKNNIKSAWLRILETLLALRNIISETPTNLKEVSSCLVLAQRLNNEFDFFKKEYEIPNDVVSENDFLSRKKEYDIEYQKLHKIFDKTSNEEMVKYILMALKDKVLKYEMYVSSLKVNSKGDMIKMLELRDEIKMLLDELEIWLGKWGGDKTRDEWEHKNKIWQQVAAYDKIWKEFVEKYEDDLEFIEEERIRHLIIEPDGSDRFEFPWWFMN